MMDPLGLEPRLPPALRWARATIYTTEPVCFCVVVVVCVRGGALPGFEPGTHGGYRFMCVTITPRGPRSVIFIGTEKSFYLHKMDVPTATTTATSET